MSTIQHYICITILALGVSKGQSFQPPAVFARHSSRLSELYSSSDPTINSDDNDAYDVIVVGSGIGGLSAAAMLAKYGNSVLVLESHYAPGGAAHGFSMRDRDAGMFHFDTGPSFFSGLNPNLPAKASNPMRTVLEAIGEQVECAEYTTFGLCFPEGNFVHSPDFENTILQGVMGNSGVKQWQTLMKNMKPLEAAVNAMPTAALRQDVGALLTAGPFLANFAKLNPLENLKLTKPFQSILNQSGIESGSFLQNWLDLLCFCLSGLPAAGTITAEMGLMMGEFYDEDATMDAPKGGAKAIVDALVLGLTKHGGTLSLKSHVDKILVEDNKATGIQLSKSGRIIAANKAVISNLSVWDLFGSGMLDSSLMKEAYVRSKLATPVGKSFMHIHVGFKISRQELDELQAHYMYMDDWNRGVTAEDNAVLLSIPSVHDDSLAPDGHAVLHIYTPATEDYARWAGLDRKSKEYEDLKEQRSAYLWEVLEKIIPDIRQRVVLSRVGTPLTHQRFLNRHQGSYGPAIVAGDASFPFPKTPINGLLTTGDSNFPGIGVPAVAGSGLLAANSVSLDSIGPQRKVLESL